MKKLIDCRRSLIAIYGITLLFLLAWFKSLDTSISIAAIITAIAASNAHEKKGKNDQVGIDEQY